MPLKKIAAILIRRAEKRLGAGLDYVHQIAGTDIGLLSRYNRLFGFLDPNRHAPVAAYHAARLRGAIAADCGTCVQIELNLARKVMDDGSVRRIMNGRYDELADGVAAAANLADAVVARREDNPEAREKIVDAFGDAALIEIAFAMNGAALLPGIKRAMGYATACDLEMLKMQTVDRSSG